MIIMIILNEILDIIYYYYPQNCQYSSDNYQNSVEYLRYKRKINDINPREELAEKIFSCLKDIFEENSITKWTNMEIPSLHFSMLTNRNQPILDDDEELLNALNGRRIDLEIYISSLTNYYYTFGIETIRTSPSSELIFNIKKENQILSKEESQKLEDVLLSVGFDKLNDEIVHAIVPNIETDLLYNGEVKVFNCLFSDFCNKF